MLLIFKSAFHYQQFRKCTFRSLQEGPKPFHLFPNAVLTLVSSMTKTLFCLKETHISFMYLQSTLELLHACHQEGLTYIPDISPIVNKEFSGLTAIQTTIVLCLTVTFLFVILRFPQEGFNPKPWIYAVAILLNTAQSNSR